MKTDILSSTRTSATESMSKQQQHGATVSVRLVSLVARLPVCRRSAASLLLPQLPPGLNLPHLAKSRGAEVVGAPGPYTQTYRRNKASSPVASCHRTKQRLLRTRPPAQMRPPLPRGGSGYWTATTPHTWPCCAGCEQTSMWRHLGVSWSGSVIGLRRLRRLRPAAHQAVTPVAQRHLSVEGAMPMY